MSTQQPAAPDVHAEGKTAKYLNYVPTYAFQVNCVSEGFDSITGLWEMKLCHFIGEMKLF